MNFSNKEIGGYFGLELNKDIAKSFPENGIFLNSARNCLRYYIRIRNIKEIYLPYYTCEVVWQAVRKEKCKIKFYHIDETFLPIEKFAKDAHILYTNYFGICASNVIQLSKQYKNLIVDNAQAFYMPYLNNACFNSPRKFFGVADGGVLYCDMHTKLNIEHDYSFNRCSHLLKRIDLSAQDGYADFCKNDLFLNKEPVKYMSKLTKYLLMNIDFEKAKEKRLNNFLTLHKKLSISNKLKIHLTDFDVPMVYPYMIVNDSLRKKLIDNKIFVAQYWSPLAADFTESSFQKYILPLPIDQRYDKNDMEKIIEVINSNG